MNVHSGFMRPRLAGVHYSLIQALHWALLAAYFSFGGTYLYNLGFHSNQVGLVFAVIGLVSAVIQPLIAVHADRSMKSAMVLRWSCALVAMAFGLLVTLWILPLSLWLHTGLYSLVWVLIMALIFLLNSLAMEYPNAGVPLNFGISRAVGSLAFAVSSYLYGICVAHYSMVVLLQISSFLALALLVALLLWRTPPRQGADAVLKTRKTGFVRRYPRFMGLVIGTTLSLTPYSMVCNFLVRIIEFTGGGSIELGTAVMITALCEIPVMLMSWWLNRKFGTYVLMLVAAIMLSAKMLMFSLARTVIAVYLAETFQLLSYPLLLCISVYYVNALMAPQERVRGQALMALVQAVSSATGALLGGFLLDDFGVNGLLWISLIISVIGSATMLSFTQKVHQTVPAGGQLDL